MSQWFKYLKLIAGFKDVSKVYREENKTDKPWYLSRRFFGSAIAFISLVVVTLFGIDITSIAQVSIVDSITVISESIVKVIPALTTLYGSILAIVGIFKNKDEEKINK